MPPCLAGEVAAEEAPHLFGSRFPAVEKLTGSEVVELAFYVELLVGDYLLLGWFFRSLRRLRMFFAVMSCGFVATYIPFLLFGRRLR